VSELGHLLFMMKHYAQTMRVLGPIHTETSDSFTDPLLAFSVSYGRALHGLAARGGTTETARSGDEVCGTGKRVPPVGESGDLVAG
jgi:hypothetical protein